MGLRQLAINQARYKWEGIRQCCGSVVVLKELRAAAAAHDRLRRVDGPGATDSV